MEGTELVAFNIIASVGTARSSYIAAIDEAAAGNFDEAEALIKEGQEAFNGGHEAHQETFDHYNHFLYLALHPDNDQEQMQYPQ
jgi:cellobiose-specific phosphotransferase system component IIA